MLVLGVNCQAPLCYRNDRDVTGGSNSILSALCREFGKWIERENGLDNLLMIAGLLNVRVGHWFRGNASRSARCRKRWEGREKKNEGCREQLGHSDLGAQSSGTSADSLFFPRQAPRCFHKKTVCRCGLR